jgi:CBS domain-containing protein
MAREMLTVPLATPLVRGARLLPKCHSRHVLVTDAEGSLVGVVSDREVLRHVVPEDAEDAVLLRSGSVESAMLMKSIA